MDPPLERERTESQMSSLPATVVRQVTRKLPEWGDVEVIALVTAEGVYFPLKMLSFVFLGDVNERAQRARVRRDPILRELTRTYPVETPGGRQQMVCLERLGIGRWINGVDVNRMRPEIRDRFLAFQWELTRLADRLLFGELEAHASSSRNVVPANPPQLHPAQINEEQLAAFLDFLARRIGNLEIDMRQIKQWQTALLAAPTADDTQA